jgi:hypothetical protein
MTRLVLLAIVAMIGLGCGSQQQTSDLSTKEAQLADRVASAVEVANQQVSLASQVVAAYQLQLAALPPSDKNRAKLEKSLAKAQAAFVTAKLYLSLIEIGVDVLKKPVVPTTSSSTTEPVQ